MISSALQSISCDATVEGLLKLCSSIIKKTKSSWRSSKYLRIVSIVTGSFTMSYFVNRVYLNLYRKHHNMPSGTYGIPFIGEAVDIADPWVTLTKQYKSCNSLVLGGMHFISINCPHLMKQIYSDPRTVDILLSFFPNADAFLFQNGKAWADRRRIIFANLMSTMKAKFVEDSTKKFVKNKVFTVFDDLNSKNEKISATELLRPLGFNIVLHACFGQESATPKDPFWIKFNKELEDMSKNALASGFILFACGGENKLSHFVRNLLGVRSFAEILNHLGSITEEFANNRDNDVKRDENDKDFKSFNDYIEEYTSSSDGKYGKKQLFADMATMFFGATDTTFAALGFCLLMAAKYPLIQRELLQELEEAFGGNIDNITLRDGAISRIPKLRAFIHEVLRIYPPVTGGGFRQMNAENFKFEADGKEYCIPKGCCLVTDFLRIHHAPKYWVKGYDPSNPKHTGMDMKKIHFDFWLDEEGKFKKNSIAFSTFSRGKRDCVGQSLAMKEIYIVIAMILMQYEVFGPNGDSQFEIKTVQKNLMVPKPDHIVLKIRK